MKTAMSAPDAASALFQLVASMPVAERELGRFRLAGALRAVVAQRLVDKPRGGGRQLVVEWVEATQQLRDAISAGVDATPFRRAIEKAAKEGKAETFARASAEATLEGGKDV